MLLVWRPEARAQLLSALSYIAERSPHAAEKLQAQIEDVVERLTEHPFMFRAGRVPGTREAIPHPNYIVVYQVGVEAVTIVSVVHATQEYP